jgi:hypothetical protein
MTKIKIMILLQTENQDDVDKTQPHMHSTDFAAFSLSPGRKSLIRPFFNFSSSLHAFTW